MTRQAMTDSDINYALDAWITGNYGDLDYAQREHVNYCDEDSLEMTPDCLNEEELI